MRLTGQLLAWATPAPEALTVQQAADRLGVSGRTIYDLCDSGDLKHQRIGTGRGTIRIRPADLDKCNSVQEQKPGAYKMRHIG
jgi:excisionase family DNA binding protein